LRWERYAPWFWRWVARSKASARCGVSVGRGSATWSRARTWGTVRAGLPPPQAQAGLDEDVMRQETQGDVMMPADPAPHLVVVEADFAFALLDAALHRPTRRRAPGQRLLREVGGGVGEEHLERRVGAEAAAQDNPHVGAGERIAHGHRAHAREPRPRPRRPHFTRARVPRACQPSHDLPVHARTARRWVEPLSTHLANAGLEASISLSRHRGRVA